MREKIKKRCEEEKKEEEKNRINYLITFSQTLKLKKKIVNHRFTIFIIF